MKFREFIEGSFFKTKNFLSKNAPTILAVTGVTTIVTAGVIAVIKAPKIKAKYDEEKAQLDTVQKCLEDGSTAEGETYTAEDALNDTKIINFRSTFALVKGYAPYVGLAAAGAGMIFLGNHISNKRLAASAAAYATLAAMFKKYRDGVMEKYGPEIDAALRSGKIEESEKERNEENGNDIHRTNNVRKVYSDYGRIFDESNPHFKKSAVYNKFFLDSVQNHANDNLRIRGRVYLNEVYEALGFEPTAAGQQVGWEYDSSRGDGYISFGHNNTNYESSCRFLEGYQPEVILDFNVDGYILDSLPQI